MDDNYRLKIKIGQHEFEAEGPSDAVKEQFQAFKELISSIPQQPSPHPQKSPTETMESATIRNAVPDTSIDVQELSKIMKSDGREVALTVRAHNIEDAILLIIYGQKMLRSKDLSTGGDILAGLESTGIPVVRIDRTLEKLGREGLLIVTGVRRSKRYRLTSIGLNKVRQIAADLLATVA